MKEVKTRKITTLKNDIRADPEIFTSAPGNSFSLFINLLGYKLGPAGVHHVHTACLRKKAA